MNWAAIVAWAVVAVLAIMLLTVFGGLIFLAHECERQRRTVARLDRELQQAREEREQWANEAASLRVELQRSLDWNAELKEAKAEVDQLIVEGTEAERTQWIAWMSGEWQLPDGSAQ